MLLILPAQMVFWSFFGRLGSVTRSSKRIPREATVDSISTNSFHPLSIPHRSLSFIENEPGIETNTSPSPPINNSVTSAAAVILEKSVSNIVNESSSSISYKNLPFIDHDHDPTIEPSSSLTNDVNTSVTSTTAILDKSASNIVKESSSILPSGYEEIDSLQLSLFTDESPTQGQPVLITVRMKPGEQGRFGFNVKGGADQNLPVLVSRVAPNTPADYAVPRLNEGDQVMSINGRNVEGLTHDQVVKLIRTTKDTQPDGELVLTINPLVYSRDIQSRADDVEDEEPPFQYIPVDASPSSRSRTISDRLLESIMLLREGLECEAILLQFEQLYKKRLDEPMDIARLPENQCKNRYRDISPYDSTRVVLKDCVLGDYVNASFVNIEIPGTSLVNRYIATQGPLSTTCEEFWQMVWEQKCPQIVMVTPLVERGRSKCHKYWPDLGQTESYGENIQVSCLKESGVNPMVERELKIIHSSNEERSVVHIQYLAWPDHGVPDDSTEFLDLIAKVRDNRPSMDYPIVVHCSAGIGRTGVLILMETAMCLIEANQPVYPLEILRSMRDQRAMLIQTSHQFRFVLEAILKVYKDGIVRPLTSNNKP